MEHRTAQVAIIAALMTEFQAAEILGISVDTLRRWRRLGTGPAYRKLGTSLKSPVRYAPRDVEAFSEACRRLSTNSNVRL